MQKMKKSSLDDISSEISPTYMVKNFIISKYSPEDGGTLLNAAENKRNLTLDDTFISIDAAILAICLRGKAKVKINFKEWYIEGNSILTVFPNDILEEIEHSDDFLAELLIFSSDYLQRMPFPKDFNLFRKIKQEPTLKISEEESQNILRYHNFIIETFNKKKHNLLDYIIKSHLYSLLLEIITLYVEKNENNPKPKITRNEEVVDKFVGLLYEYYKEGRTASFYANKMFMSPKYLSSILKKVTGRPINSWIEDAIISGAKLYLKSSDLTIAQISEELNFPNPSYFGRFFKKKTNLTPKQYRNS